MRIIPALALAAALAACTPYVSVSTTTISGPVIRVEPVDYGSVTVGPNGLGPREERAVAARIRSAAEDSPEAVEILLVGGSQRTLGDIAALARREGVPSRNVVRAPDGAAGGSGEVIFTRYVAVPPECRERAIVGGTPGSPGLGCAALQGLALAVADPRSLLGRPDVVLAPRGRR